MNEKDILADIGKLTLQREQVQRHAMLIDQRMNDLKIELMKARKNDNDAHDAEPADSASQQRNDG